MSFKSTFWFLCAYSEVVTSTMNPRLTRNQQKAICSQLGNVKLQLLFKASINGFTSAAFHQRCDNHSPTVTVGYNSSGYMFGGYTSQPFSQSGQYVNDDDAFLFSLSGEYVTTYPTSYPCYAMKMISNTGPYFGEDLIFLHGGQKVTFKHASYYNSMNAAVMHGNNLNLIECEVYEVVPARNQDNGKSCNLIHFCYIHTAGLVLMDLAGSHLLQSRTAAF